MQRIAKPVSQDWGKVVGLAGAGAMSRIAKPVSQDGGQVALVGASSGLKSSWQLSRIAKPVSQDWGRLLGLARVFRAAGNCHPSPRMGIKLLGLAWVCQDWGHVAQ